MNIHIHTKGFDLTSGIKGHIEKRIHFSLSRVQIRIDRIDIHLSDINGPKGGVDKQCNISIHPKKMANITISDTKENLYEAIDHAINRASHSLIRKVSRSQKLSRITRRIKPIEDPVETEEQQLHSH
ncbi:MAG: putative sigma-54 modulation protein [Gammaproteobacteria bacterium]|jgi:putative sigma-54 modulation protein